MSGPRSVEPPLRVLDNPILRAQALRRLRRKQLVPSLLITAILGVCGVMFAVAQGAEVKHWTGLVYGCLIYIGGALLLRGTSQVASALSEERRSGILDFHRATPTTPWTDALGYLVGCAAREYALAAVALPFLVLAAVLSKLPLLGVLGAAAMLVLCGLFYHGAAMVIGLTVSSRRGMMGSAALMVPLILGLAFPLYKAGFVTIAYLSPFPAVLRLLGQSEAIAGSVSFYGLSLHPVLFALLVQGSILIFLLLGAVRKLRREGAALFSRPGAAAFFALLIYLSFGGAWAWIRGDGQLAADSGISHKDTVHLIVLSYLYGALGVGAWLLASVSPSYLDFLRALRRAQRRGGEVSFLDDGAPTWPLAGALGLILCAGLAVLAMALAGRVPTEALLSKDTAVGVLGAVSFFLFVGGAADFVRLCQRRSERSSAVFLVFVTMILPWLLCGIVASISAGKGLALYLGAASPNFAAGASAMMLAAAWGQQPSPEAPQLAVGLSILLTGCAAGWFLSRARALQVAVSQKSAPR